MNDIEIINQVIYTEQGEKMSYIDIDNAIDNECENFIQAIQNLIQRNKLLEKQILEDSSYAMLTKLEAKLKYDINKINEKLLSDEYINDYRKTRLKGIRTKCKEILNIIGG